MISVAISVNKSVRYNNPLILSLLYAQTVEIK
jgi:hypothetical protein